MEIIERISDLLAERDKTAVELCKALDIQTSTMSTWKTRKKDPQLCFWAFRHNRWVGIIIFTGIFIALL